MKYYICYWKTRREKTFGHENKQKMNMYTLVPHHYSAEVVANDLLDIKERNVVFLQVLNDIDTIEDLEKCN